MSEAEARRGGDLDADFVGAVEALGNVFRFVDYVVMVVGNISQSEVEETLLAFS